MVLTLGGGGDGEVKQGIVSTRGSEVPAQVSGLGSGLADGQALSDRKLVAIEKSETEKSETKKEKIQLVNRAGESRSPYVSLTNTLLRVGGAWSERSSGLYETSRTGSEMLLLTFHLTRFADT